MLKYKNIYLYGIITCIVCVVCVSSFSGALYAETATIIQDKVEIVKAKVLEVLSQEKKLVPGTDVQSIYQTIKVEILEGEKKGQIVNVENDYLTLKEGDRFFMRHGIDGVDGRETFFVSDIDRRWSILFFVALFFGVVIFFLGKQGVRSLIGLAGSFVILLYVLVPGLIKGYPPVLTSVVIATTILFLAIFLTHGFNRISVVAFSGTVVAVSLTSALAYIAVYSVHLTGFSTDEAVYLNFNTRGTLDFVGLLLGGMIIGILGVLDDIAVTQAAVVSELYNSASHLSKKEIYTRSLRVGKEHVGALVNTLALAYTGATLPLILLFSTSEASMSSIINQEVFATEIIRIVIGSIGLILTVPITTLLAVYMLKGYKDKHHYSNGHAHGHIHTHSH